MPFPDLRWFRMLLRLYPRSFRKRYGREMERAYLRLLALEGRRRSWIRRGWVRARALGDALVRGLALRLRDEVGGGRRPARQTYRASATRDGRVRMGMERWIRDARYALRALRRQPLYVAASVSTLGLGIGATTAVFSVVHGVLLAPLPAERPERLVRVYLEEPERPGGREYLTAMDALLVRQQEEVLSEVAVFYDYEDEGADLTGDGSAERVRTLPVSSGYFRLLGTEPLLGREMAADEEREDARVAVVSHGLWTRRFGGDAAALGGTLHLDEVAHTVVGILPADFRDPLATGVDVYMPQDLDPANTRNDWGNHYVSAVARLAPGVTLEQAVERVRAVALAANQANRDEPDYWLPRLVPLHEDLVGRAETLLWVLLGAVGLVLLLACTNVANLSLARGVARARELAVRSALGAGRGGLVRQLLAEALLIALTGGAAGMVLALAAVSAFQGAPPDWLPRADRVGVDLPVLLFTVTVTLLTVLVFGLLPALRDARSDPVERLRQGARGSTAGSYRLRRVLVAGQTALAMMLLVGAALLARSFLALQDVDLGLDPDRVLVYEVHLPEARYPDGDARIALYRQLHERVRALPGVEAAGAIHWLPVQGRGYRWGLWRLDAPPGTEPIGADVRIIDADYFGALKIGLVRGRGFGSEDGPDGRPVALLNRRAAERLFSDAGALDAEIRIGGREWTVVGVVEDVANDALGDVTAKVYLPHAQFADRHWALVQVVSTSGEPGSLVGPLRELLAGLDARLVLHRPRPLEDILSAGVARHRFAATVMVAFAGLALLLAMVGIYGVLAFLVGRRRHEIGIRMALGAAARDVRRLVVRESLLVASGGVLVGVAGAAALSRWLRSLVFQVEVTDPRVYLAAGLGLVAAALLSASVPARRAAAVDPARAFRNE